MSAFGGPAKEATLIDLYYWPTPNGWKATIMLEECGLKYRLIPVDIGRGDQFKPEFLRISPNNRMPAIVDHHPLGGGEPLAIFESSAILAYLADKTGKFLPLEVAARYRALQWVHWQAANLGPMMGNANHFKNDARNIVDDPKMLAYGEKRFVGEVDRLSAVMDAQLSANEYLAGAEYSIADISSWPWAMLIGRMLGEEMWENCPHLKRWVDQLRARPALDRGFRAHREWGQRELTEAEEKAHRELLLNQDSGKVRAVRKAAAQTVAKRQADTRRKVELADTEARLNAFQVFLEVKRRMDQGTPCSVVRLGDGEGIVLGYPEFTNRRDVDEYLLRWIRTKDVAEADVRQLVDALRAAVKDADIVGLPRPRLMGYRSYRAVTQAIEAFNLRSASTLVTYTPLQRLLQYALLYRPLLQGVRFLGLISCRDIAEELQALFGIRATRWYGVRGEDVTHFTDFDIDQPGPIETMHYPDGYRQLYEELTVPFPGALFLVGAGAFGKIYCHWIKQRGGVAIDIGSLFDSWAGVGRIGRGLGVHAFSLAVYGEMPSIRRDEAIQRYNDLLQRLGLDDISAAPTDAAYIKELPESW